VWGPRRLFNTCERAAITRLRAAPGGPAKPPGQGTPAMTTITALLVGLGYAERRVILT
jgi:hypothetical protein